MPKIPAYLRIYHRTWERNSRIKDSVKQSKAGMEGVESYLKVTGVPTAQHPALPASMPYAGEVVAPAGLSGTVEENAAGVEPEPEVVERVSGGGVEAGSGPESPQAVAVLAPPPQVVGGMVMAAGPPSEAKERKQRGKDKGRRAPRKCALCKSKGRSGAAACPGSNNRGNCLHFNLDGTRKGSNSGAPAPAQAQTRTRTQIRLSAGAGGWGGGGVTSGGLSGVSDAAACKCNNFMQCIHFWTVPIRAMRGPVQGVMIREEGR